MASRKEQHDVEAHRATRATARVYLPCPACGRAVLLSDESRIAADPETYECGSCDARFYLEDGL